jgi:hypothetical protein
MAADPIGLERRKLTLIAAAAGAAQRMVRADKRPGVVLWIVPHYDLKSDEPIKQVALTGKLGAVCAAHHAPLDFGGLTFGVRLALLRTQHRWRTRQRVCRGMSPHQLSFCWRVPIPIQMSN